MKFQTFSLYNEVNDEIKYQYSLQKLGDLNALNYFSNALTQLITQNQLITKSSVLFAGVKYPYSNLYRKNFVLLTEHISKVINLPIVYAYYDYNYDPKSFYDNQIDRKAINPELSQENKEKYKGSDFIIIDDSIITGTTINALRKSLESIANCSSIVCIFDLKNKNVVERELNEYYFKQNGLDGLIALFNEKGFIPTSQMLRIIEALDLNDRKNLLSKIPCSQEVIKAYTDYSGRMLNL